MTYLSNHPLLWATHKRFLTWTPKTLCLCIFAMRWSFASQNIVARVSKLNSTVYLFLTTAQVKIRNKKKICIIFLMFFLKTCYRTKVFDILMQQNIYVSYKAFAAINLFLAFQLIKKRDNCSSVLMS